MTAYVLTANRLDNGAVVYRDAAGDWVDSLADAAPAEGEAAEQALLAEGAAAVARRQVVGPYLIEVASGTASPAPITQRERIRAAGPTVRAGSSRTG